MASHLVWEGYSWVVKVFSFQKNPAKELISEASLLVFIAQGFALDGRSVKTRLKSVKSQRNVTEFFLSQ